MEIDFEFEQKCTCFFLRLEVHSFLDVLFISNLLVNDYGLYGVVNEETKLNKSLVYLTPAEESDFGYSINYSSIGYEFGDFSREENVIIKTWTDASPYICISKETRPGIKKKN